MSGHIHRQQRRFHTGAKLSFAIHQRQENTYSTFAIFPIKISSVLEVEFIPYLRTTFLGV